MEHLSSLELSQSIVSKQLSVMEAVDFYHKNYIEKDGSINAFSSYDYDYASRRAREVQKEIDAGESPSPLAGVPIGIKDNISMKGFPLGCSSKMLDGYTPVFNATVIDKIEKAGLIVMGKLNMDEFAMGSSSETGSSGPVKNPWDLSRVAGGSSGGSAAAVAAREIPLALGSDTGGSIRQPCAFCGISGIKPSYGRVSRYGLVAYASSLDQIGPMGRTIGDCSALLEIISGQDGMDEACTIREPYRYSMSPGEGLRGLRIGIPENYFEQGIDEEVKEKIISAGELYKDLGADLSYFSMPLTELMIPSYYIIASAEASSNLSRFDGLTYGYQYEGAGDLQELYQATRNTGFGLEVKRRIMLGSFVLSSGYYDAYYKKADQVRQALGESYKKIFEDFDVILSPVTPTTAYTLGSSMMDPLKMYMGDIFTVSVNLAGLPAVSLPCGFDSRRLPVGLQLIGNYLSEETLIRTAAVFQSHTDFHKALPGAGHES